MASLSVQGLAGKETFQGCRTRLGRRRLEQCPSLSRSKFPVDSLPQLSALYAESLLKAKPAVCLAQNETTVVIETSEGKVRPTSSELARTLTAVCPEGTLTTVSSDGWPISSLVQFALDAEGRPVLRLVGNSSHKVNSESNNRSSLHVQFELPGKQKPQCTLKGRLVRAADEESNAKLGVAWQRRFESGDDLKTEPLWWIEVEEVLVIQDLEEDEVWVAGSEYSEATPDPLRDYAAKIVADMNRNHWQDIRRFCFVYGGVEDEVEEVSMTWVDKLGFDLRVLLRETQQLREIRIPFDREVRDDRDARSSIMIMAQTLWELERNYIPPVIPLNSSQTVS